MILIDKEFFANDVHNYIVYENIDETLKKYEKRLLNELSVRKLTQQYFQDKVIIDIGTGFQAIIAIKFGAKYVYHLDISNEQVLKMQEFCKFNNINNIKSIQCDITKNIPINDTIDLVFIFGVWHHLVNPNLFMQKLIPKMNLKGSSIWFRVYRSGSWSRWLTSKLREISNDIEKELFKKHLEVRYPYKCYNQFKGDMIDDLYAPVWQSFHPLQFKLDEASIFYDDEFWEYNFDEKDENFRVDFYVDGKTIKKINNFVFPDNGIDQESFVFNNSYVKLLKVQELFDIFKLKKEDDAIKVNKIISLYETIRKKPLYDSYFQVIGIQEINKDYKLFTNRINYLLSLLEIFTKD